MIKIILWTIVIITLNLNYASAKVSFSAFTKDGRVLNEKFSILTKQDKFRIIFYSDSASQHTLTIKVKSKVINKQNIKLSTELTLPGNNKWFQLGKTNDLIVVLSNDENRIELQYRLLEVNRKPRIDFNKLKFIGEERQIEINYVPEPENITLEDKTITMESIVVRSGRDIFRKYSSSVVLIVAGGSQGSGFLVSDSAILTNWHVVRGYESVGIIFKPKGFNSISFKKQAIADVVLLDKSKDIALLFLRRKSSKKPLSFPDSQNIEVADEVHAIGHPLREYWTYTKGYISQLRPNYKWTVGGNSFNANVIQTQTPINPGNSGGPLFDKSGKVVGINTFVNTNSDGLNYAISIIDVLKFMENSKNIPNRTIKKSKQAKSRLVDLDDDGFADAEVVDMDEDGSLDTLIEKDIEKGIITWHRDKNKNGVIELMIVFSVDDNGEKLAVIFKDLDEDGNFDTRAIDYGIDGKIDYKEIL